MTTQALRPPPQGELLAFIPSSNVTAGVLRQTAPAVASRSDHPPHLDPAGDITAQLRKHVEENGWPA